MAPIGSEQRRVTRLLGSYWVTASMAP